ISFSFPFISLFIIAIQWTFSVIVIAGFYAGIISLFVKLFIMGVEWAISVITFSTLPYISRRSYELAMTNSSRRYHNRYQSIENIRTAQVLNRLVRFLSVSEIFLLTYYT
ncbi:hypothetical protein PFISCL1PPCAC_14461, partial [Pristionchus fissidentatus]